MAGTPIRAARRALNVPASFQLPHDFDSWPDARKIERMMGLSLTQAARVLSWPVDELAPHRLAIWDQVRKHLWNVCLRVQERRLDREAEEAFREAMERSGATVART